MKSATCADIINSRQQEYIRLFKRLQITKDDLDAQANILDDMHDLWYSMSAEQKQETMVLLKGVDNENGDG